MRRILSGARACQSRHPSDALADRDDRPLADIGTDKPSFISRSDLVGLALLSFAEIGDSSFPNFRLGTPCLRRNAAVRRGRAFQLRFVSARSSREEQSFQDVGVPKETLETRR